MNSQRYFHLLRAREFELCQEADMIDGMRLFGLCGDSQLSVDAGLSSCVLALRGEVEIQSSEGRFLLYSGQRMMLDAESAPLIRSLRGGLAAVLCYRGSAIAARYDVQCELPLPGIDTFARTEVSALRQLRRLLQATLSGSEHKRIEYLALQLLPPPDSEARSWLMRCPGRTLTRKRQVLARLQRARLHIEGHPDRVHRLSELAAITRFSPWHFSKAFQCVYGMSPQHFGKSTRLEHARRLLRDEHLSISEIAAASGFDNPSSFARAFHSRFGASASALRNSRT